MLERYSFVSCDIVGHAAEPSLALQVARVEAINAIARRVIQNGAEGAVVWASGGDGGHVAIRTDQPKNLALDLIADLRQWSASANVRLRLSAHVGDVEATTGADGRVQLVGHGINLAARLLNYSDQNRVIASETFRELYRADEPPGVRFHSDRSVAPKAFPLNSVYLLSMTGRFESSWQGVIEDEQSVIAQSFQEGRYWDVIFHARRLMEANARNAEAIRYLSRLLRDKLTYRDSFSQQDRTNPLLGTLDSSSLVDLVGAAQLVQRNAGEVLCRLGDEGDAMFIILRGDVGVIFAPQTPSAPTPRSPDVVLTPGAIVGEIAFALNRRRTATLQCLSPTWLLSINSDFYDATLKRATAKETLRRTMSRFRLERVLEHVCKHSPLFVGKDKDRPGPLADVSAPWEALVDDSALIAQPWKADAVVTRRLKDFKPAGVYVLVGGELQEKGNKVNVLAEQDLPVVYADLRGMPRRESPGYLVRADATILFIRESGFLDRLFTDVYRRFIGAVSTALERREAGAPARSAAGGKATRLKVLYLASNPFTTPSLQLDLEIREIQAKIQTSQHRDALEAIPKLAVRPDDLQQALLATEPHVVHFSGHGATTGGLLLEDANRKEITVQGDAILSLFKALPDNLRGVIFNACYSHGLAESAVQVVDFAIGMKDAIADEASILFSSAFYHAVGFGRSVQTAFDLGIAAIKMSNVASSAALPHLFVRRGLTASSLVLIPSPE